MTAYLPGHPDLDGPPINIHVTCTTCRQQAASGPEYNRDAALDLLDALGWVDLTTWPLCPDCASWPNGVPA